MIIVPPDALIGQRTGFSRVSGYKKLVNNLCPMKTLILFSFCSLTIVTIFFCPVETKNKRMLIVTDEKYFLRLAMGDNISQCPLYLCVFNMFDE